MAFPLQWTLKLCQLTPVTAGNLCLDLMKKKLIALQLERDKKDSSLKTPV